jgi:hypothetical protein
MNLGTCDEFVILGEQADGTWTVVSVDGQPPTDPSKGTPWAEPFEDGPDAFTDLPVFEHADWVEVERGGLDLCRSDRCLPTLWVDVHLLQCRTPPSLSFDSVYISLGILC